MSKKLRSKHANGKKVSLLNFIDSTTIEHHKIVDLYPKTNSQKSFVKSIRANEISIGIGPAGVGKTFCTAGVAAQMLNDRLIDGIILSRANVLVGRSIGCLPGDPKEKLEPLLDPILGSLKRFLGDSKVKYLLNKSSIELLPFEYIRGKNFSNKFVIIDEAQNLTINDLIAVITRYESGKMVLLGDPFQNDLKNECGLTWLEDFIRRTEFYVPVTNFTINDVVRSGVVKRFIQELYKDFGLIPGY